MEIMGKTEKRVALKRKRKLSIAIPASIVGEYNSLRRKTHILGQIGRASAIYRVDDIVIYPDDPDESTLMKYILGYMETPQYLRKQMFQRQSELRYVGVLPPLRTPHHPLGKNVSDLKVGEFREGVIISKEKDKTQADIGVNKLITINRKTPPAGNRTTVRITNLNPLEGIPAKKSEVPFYWGYNLMKSKDRLSELAYRHEYDLTIGTSRKGENYSKLVDFAKRWENSKSVLVVFGSNIMGVHDVLAKEGKKAEEVFDYIINTIPNQGSHTVRTEEAIHSTLSILNLLE
jgi:predicted SPOUT superfamily RNA methylase MTH1